MKDTLKKIGTIIVIILVIAIVAWVYPISMKADQNGENTCYNIFGHWVQCND